MYDMLAIFLQQEAREEQATAHPTDASATSAREGGAGTSMAAASEAEPAQVAVEGAEARSVGAGVGNALCEAFSEEEDEGEAGVTVEPEEVPLDLHGPDLSKAYGTISYISSSIAPLGFAIR